jgi:hypothetical protein
MNCTRTLSLPPFRLALEGNTVDIWTANLDLSSYEMCRVQDGLRISLQSFDVSLAPDDAEPQFTGGRN